MASLDSTAQRTTHHAAPYTRRGRGFRRPARGGFRASVDPSRDDSTTPSQPTSQAQGNILRTRNPRDATLSLTPASVEPVSRSYSAEPLSTDTSGTENATIQSTRGGQSRGHRRGGGRDLGGHRRHGNRLSNGAVNTNGQTAGHSAEQASIQPSLSGRNKLQAGRQFGGQLSTSSNLQPDAPEFHPSQQNQTRAVNFDGYKKSSSGQAQVDDRIHRHRRDSSLKSTAPDIATRIHEDISNGLYECPICTSELAKNSRIWSCTTCWTVFHLSCIKKWSTNEGSTLNQRQNEGELSLPRQWRCPGCNLPTDVLPSAYTCWCKKEVDPRSVSGLPPHSCGQTCGKPRVLPKKCPHPCELLCHAGPCPPCTHTGPTQICFCGKKRTGRRCADTDYVSGWSCGKICADLMPCYRHTCRRPCHEGLCGACEVEMESRCYCGKIESLIACCERGDEKTSVMTHVPGNEVESWEGSFDCGSRCERLFDCRRHRCKKKCHPQNLELPHCPRSPDMITRCPCGKTSIEDISNQKRASCEDPIPSCDKICRKKLACGHPCQQVCHSGECAPCLLTVAISCCCGRVESPTICHQGKEHRPQCMRTCRATLNCGRHECGERCCSGERKASERQATKRKLRPLGASRTTENDIEAEHICTRLCDRLLKCGTHTCTDLCHKGPCRSCREAIFDEVSCHCGKTVLQPPLPCGTKSPPCRFDCERAKMCGHPRVPHNCHGDDEGCPKCPFLMEKPCMCGKKILKNQPCWLADARCGDVCGKKLKCGSHFCRKPCHRLGECEDAGKPCRQSCGKPKKACGHPCDDPCHAPSICREDKPCQNKFFITCDCQHLKQEMKCNASRISDGNIKKSLSCDDDCARLERNRKLALALNIDPETHKDDHIPYSSETLRYFQENVKWAQTQEREFRVFAADENEKRLRFKPMPSTQRAFLRSLSEDFGLDSESMDPEPHRHVAVFKTPRFVMAPMKTLAECLRIRVAAEAAKPIVTKDNRKSISSSNTPFNGFLLAHPRFGLTVDELRSDFASSLESTPGLTFDISFLPNEEIVLKAKPATPSTNISTSSVEASVRALKSSLAGTTASKHLAVSIQLCTLDASLNILRRELDDSMASGGWSKVAAKAAAPRQAPRQIGVGEKSVYTVLGSRLKDAKRKKEEEMSKAKVKAEQEPVVEDWEEEVRKEEEVERRDNDSSGGDATREAEKSSGNAGEATDATAVDGKPPEEPATSTAPNPNTINENA